MLTPTTTDDSPISPYPSLPQLTPNTALPVLLPTFLGKEETSEDVGP